MMDETNVGVRIRGDRKISGVQFLHRTLPDGRHATLQRWVVRRFDTVTMCNQVAIDRVYAKAANQHRAVLLFAMSLVSYAFPDPGLSWDRETLDVNMDRIYTREDVDDIVDLVRSAIEYDTLAAIQY